MKVRLKIRSIVNFELASWLVKISYRKRSKDFIANFNRTVMDDKIKILKTLLIFQKDVFNSIVLCEFLQLFTHMTSKG